jgi:hypothetical protein
MTSLTSTAFAADVSDVIVRQQWPWSTGHGPLLATVGGYW